MSNRQSEQRVDGRVERLAVSVPLVLQVQVSLEPLLA